MVPFERFLVAAAVLVLASCERTPAQDQHGATNAQQTADASVTGDQHADLDVAWASLDPKVGQYPSQIGLFTKSAVVDDLRALLGEARLQTLQQNFETASPLQRDETVLFTSGNRAHEGGSEAAYLLLDQSHKAVNRRPKRTPYRRPKGTPFVVQRDGYGGRAVRAGCGVGRA